MGIFIIKIRRLWDSLVFIIGIHKLVRDHHLFPAACRLSYSQPCKGFHANQIRCNKLRNHQIPYHSQNVNVLSSMQISQFQLFINTTWECIMIACLLNRTVIFTVAVIFDIIVIIFVVMIITPHCYLFIILRKFSTLVSSSYIVLNVSLNENGPMQRYILLAICHSSASWHFKALDS